MRLLVLCALSGCQLPPPSHALLVRDFAGKCALIAFSGCAPLPGQDRASRDDEPDAN